MFERIGNVLPAYQEYFEIFMNRRNKRAADKRAAGLNFPLNEVCHERVSKALSYVYADILQFCQAACKIFSPKNNGM
jgi:hypothetical protein